MGTQGWNAMSLPLTHAGGSVDGISAALDLRFASSLSLTSTSGLTPSFSRASTGTFFNSSGVLTTAAINGPRFNHVYNGSSWVSKGLLVEEQRVNYVKYANDLSTNWINEGGATREYNSIASPDGSTNATKINVAVSDYSGIFQTPLLNAGSGIYTYSIFAKKGTKDWLWILNTAGAGASQTSFNISNGTIGTVNSGYSATITNCGNGWYRCTLTTTTSTPTWFQFGFSDANNSIRPASTGYSYVYGAQIELGSFATSFIPNNTASSVTRSADVCQITGSNFTSFWNASEGTISTEFDRLSPLSAGGQTYPRTFLIGTSGNNFIDHFTNHNSPYEEIFQSYSGGVLQFAFNGYMSTGITTQKYALAFANNNSAVSMNGTAVQTDNTCTVPTVTANMAIGYNLQNGSSYLNGHIARLRYFNKRLTNNQLEDLCKPEQQLKLDLNFSSNLSLTPTVGPTPSFSRASTGTYFNSSGVLTSAAINEPRFDHVYDGTSWVSKGLLIEEQRTNLCTYSEDITNASWNKYNSVAILSNNATAPDGTLTADRLYPTLSGANLLEKVISGQTSGSTYSYSYYAKSAGFQWIRGVEVAGGASFWVDVVNGVVGTKQTSSAGAFTVSIAPAGNGWFKISVTSNSNSTNTYIYTSPADANGNTTSTPSGTNGILYWGFQFELGTFPTSYIPTVASSVVRSADVCQITGSAFTNLWNASEGSFAAESYVNGFNVSGVNYIGSASNGGLSQYAFIGRFNGSLTSLNFQVYNGVPAADILYTATSATPTKTAFGMKASDCAASVNGDSVSADTTVTMTTTLTQLEIGNFLGNNYLNGHIARLRYYAIRLPNRLLIAKST
jgi:hypothetical protein